jgi:hypothetical protein
MFTNALLCNFSIVLMDEDNPSQKMAGVGTARSPQEVTAFSSFNSKGALVIACDSVAVPSTTPCHWLIILLN